MRLLPARPSQGSQTRAHVKRAHIGKLPPVCAAPPSAALLNRSFPFLSPLPAPPSLSLPQYWLTALSSLTCSPVLRLAPLLSSLRLEGVRGLTIKPLYTNVTNKEVAMLPGYVIGELERVRRERARREERARLELPLLPPLPRASEKDEDSPKEYVPGSTVITLQIL